MERASCFWGCTELSDRERLVKGRAQAHWVIEKRSEEMTTGRKTTNQDNRGHPGDISEEGNKDEKA
eukprot:scaffold1604_cov103-Skeletonema_marinoi.AAC.2